MIEIEPIIEKFYWETSQGNNYQHYVCEINKKAEFEDLIIYIKNHGYVVTIQGKSYVCVEIGGYLYWTMWNSIEDPDFINRMHVDRVEPRSVVFRNMIEKLILCWEMYLNELCEWLMHPSMGRFKSPRQ